jgi:hypothetical protein
MGSRPGDLSARFSMVAFQDAMGVSSSEALRMVSDCYLMTTQQLTNELTLARRTSPGMTVGHGFAFVAILSFSKKGLILGAKLSNRKLGGIEPCRKARDVLSKPANPAVPSVCPMSVFTEPQ